jgi:hypothetical protein
MLMEWAAGSNLVRKSIVPLTQVILGLGAAISAVATVSLSKWLLTLAFSSNAAAVAVLRLSSATGIAATSIGAFSGAVRIAMGATGLGLLALALTSGISLWANWGKGSEGATDALDELKRALLEHDDAMNKEIDNIKTATDRYEAMAHAAADAEEAIRKMHKAQAEGKPREAAQYMWESIAARARGNRAEAVDEFKAGPIEEGLRDKNIQGKIDIEEQQFQERLSAASPAQQKQMLEKRSHDMFMQAAEANAGNVAAIKYERALPGDQAAIAAGAPRSSSTYLLKHLQLDPSLSADEQSMAAEAGRAALKREGREHEFRSLGIQYGTGVANLGRSIPEGATRSAVEYDIATSKATGAETSFEQNRIRLEGIRKLRDMEEAGLKDETKLAALNTEEAQIRKQDRERRMEVRGLAYGENISRSIQQAELTGGDSTRYRNVGAAAEKYGQLRTFLTEDAAKKRAIEFQSNAISLQAGQNRVSLNAAAAVSDLARIGGGGNVEQAQAGVEDILKQQRDLQTDMVKYLAVMAGKYDNQLSLR